MPRLPDYVGKIVQPYYNTEAGCWMGLEEIEHGGPGSGHFGHEGRPGERGGSAPGTGPSEDEIKEMTDQIHYGTSESPAIQRIKILPDNVKKYSLLSDSDPAVRKYVGAGYTYINRYLREGEPPGDMGPYGPSTDTINDEVAELHRIVSNAPPLPEGTHIYRGLGTESGYLIGHASVGDVVEDKAFQSFSADAGMARSFAQPYVDDDDKSRITVVRATLDGKRPTIFTRALDQPEGSPEHIIGASAEREVLCDKGARWKVTDIRDVTRSDEKQYILGADRVRVVSVVPA